MADHHSRRRCEWRLFHFCDHNGRPNPSQETDNRVEGLMGRVGVADSDFQPDGKVLVYGEIWNAESDEAVKKGDKVEVVRVDHLKLFAKKFTPSR